MEDEWIIVSRKSKKKRYASRKSLQNMVLPSQSKCDFDPADVDEMRAKIERAVKELELTEFCTDFLQLVSTAFFSINTEARTTKQLFNVSEIICYGLGSISDSYISRYQLAMLLILWEYLMNSMKLNCELTHEHKLKYKTNDKVLKKRTASDEIPKPVLCKAYDPIFRPLEIAVLESFGISIIEENAEGKRKTEFNHQTGTLYFMIHCHKMLYNTLMSEIYQSDMLTKAIIIGNTFSSLPMTLPLRKLKEEYEYLYHVIANGQFKELQIKNWQLKDEVFNDTAIHWFTLKK